MDKLSIVIPAFNEQSRLGATLEDIARYENESKRVEVIVVDDGSTDSTAELVREFCRHYPFIRLVSNEQNRGKGFSVRRGVQVATGDIILMMDADQPTPIAECTGLIQAIRCGCDVAIGSRVLNASLQQIPPPLRRRVCSFAFRMLVRLLLGLRFKDTQCGFKAFTRAAAKAIFAMQQIERWGFDPELLLLAERLSLRIAEVPVRTFHREGSKVHMVRDAIHMFLELLMIRRNLIQVRNSRSFQPAPLDASLTTVDSSLPSNSWLDPDRP